MAAMLSQRCRGTGILSGPREGGQAVVYVNGNVNGNDAEVFYPAFAGNTIDLDPDPDSDLDEGKPRPVAGPNA